MGNNKIEYRELSFKDLPFIPIGGQVIYLEPSYSRTLNRFISYNYDWIIKVFSNKGLQFCYLPRLAREVIKYNAPHLNSTRREEIMKNVPSLTDFLAKGELDRPMLLFGTDEAMTDPEGNMVLLALPIKLRWYKSIADVFMSLLNEIPGIVKEKERELLRKRRNEECRSLFIDSDFDDSLFPDKIGINPEERPKKSYEREMQELLDEVRSLQREQESGPGPKYSLRSDRIRREKDPETAERNFDTISQQLMSEVREKVEALMKRGVNVMILHEIIDELQKVSRLKITGTFRIILVDYDNMEVKMGALQKAVFILFLRHPEGIRFKELSDYYSELLALYRQMNPIGSYQKHLSSIAAITDPCSNSINEKCAQIRSAFTCMIDASLARHYCITGKQGEPKRIALDASMVIWE